MSRTYGLCQPFAIDLRCMACTVPAPVVGANAGIPVNTVVAELEDYEQWRSAQVALTHSDQTRQVCFRNDANDSSVDSSVDPVFPLSRPPLHLRFRLTITVYSEQGILCELAMQESAAFSCPRVCMVSGLVKAYHK
jgi:hypothetical protein